MAKHSSIVPPRARNLGPIRPGFVLSADHGQPFGEQIRREAELKRQLSKPGRNGQAPLAVVTKADLPGERQWAQPGRRA